MAVEGNSISQQLHLFFGTPISDNPATHGIRPKDMTRPSYLAVCRDFETTNMSAEEIRRVSLFWRLHRTDFGADVDLGRNLLVHAGFITGNARDFADHPEADIFLTQIYLHLEEYQRAAALLGRLRNHCPDTGPVRDFLAGPFTGFKAGRRSVAGPGCRVIYDCRGMLDGTVVPATEAFYQEAIIGDQTLLPDFEQGLLGMRGGGMNQFPVRFPTDYGNPELAGRTLTFLAYLHQVLEPVQITSIEEVANLPRNKYRFSDLAALREHNEKLYYLVLKDMIFRSLHQEMTDFLALLNFRLKLGFHEEARTMLPRRFVVALCANLILYAHRSIPITVFPH